MAYSLLEALKETCFRKPELNICIVGIDDAGKTSILERSKGEFGSKLPPLPLNKITTTVGMNMAKMELGGCKVTFWDLGGEDRIRSLWDRYYAETHAWIFVVDSANADRLRESRDAFCAAVDHPELSDAPCLVLANKQDALGACGTEELAALFEIRTRDTTHRRVEMRPCSAISNDNIRESIVWVVNQARLNAPRVGAPSDT